MEHKGDITKISGYDVPIVDVVTFGAPCQDLSVAGKRKGMQHTDMGDEETTRSGLFHEAIRIIKEMRDKDAKNRRVSDEHIRPRFAVYENVPGAFSSNKGKDFKVVLEEIAKVVDKDAVIPMPPKDKWTTSGAIVGDGWSIAWRVLDAQFWGVPQRRRRIALIADFGGGCAQEILFVRHGLSGDSEKSRTERESPSTDAQGCIGVHDRDGEGADTVNGRGKVQNCQSMLRDRQGTDRDGEKRDGNCLTPWDVQSRQIYTPDGPWFTLYAGEGGGRGYIAIPNEKAVSFEPGIASREGGHIYEDVSGTLRANAGDNQMSVAYQSGDSYLFENHSQDTRYKGPLDVAPTVSATFGMGGNNQPFVVEPTKCYDIGDRRSVANESVDVSPTLLSKMGTGGNNVPVIMEQEIVDSNYIDVETEVAVRKYDVDCDALCKCLRKHKDSLKLTNKHIAEQVDRSVTEVEHWFRTDKHFAIPSPDVWFELKEMLGIETDHCTTEDDIAQPLKARDYKDPLTICYCVDQGGGKSGANVTENLSPTLTCTHGGEPVIAMATQQGGAEIRADDICPTLTAAAGMSGNNQPVICLQGNGIDRADTAGCNGKGWKEDISYTLNTVDRPAIAYDGAMSINWQAAAGAGLCVEEELASPLACTRVPAIVYKKPHYIVRRLTPLECERLQGFPDGWTDIGEYIDSKGKKKQSSDSARYKALGNSIALPPWKWVMKRIAAQYERDATLGSLFDGIGGFPLIWEQINGKGSCLWASEIEDFPIAVTTVRIE